MQDLQQQSAMLQKEYEYEKDLYRLLTREAGIPKRIQQGVCWFPVKLGADRYNSLNQLTVEVTRTETEELIKRNTRRLAKRQMTWLRKNDEVIWIKPGDRAFCTELIHEKLGVEGC